MFDWYRKWRAKRRAIKEFKKIWGLMSPDEKQKFRETVGF